MLLWCCVSCSFYTWRSWLIPIRSARELPLDEFLKIGHDLSLLIPPLNYSNLCAASDAFENAAEWHDLIFASAIHLVLVLGRPHRPACHAFCAWLHSVQIPRLVVLSFLGLTRFRPVLWLYVGVQYIRIIHVVVLVYRDFLVAALDVFLRNWVLWVNICESVQVP
jgi:hypothetical protein